MRLPAKWTSGQEIDAALIDHPRLFDSKPKKVTFTVPVGCKLKIGACVRFLSLVNQLVFRGSQIEISFDEGATGAMGYLSRMGFFENLSPAVSVKPERPDITGRAIYGGGNASLVEIVALSVGKRDQKLPQKLGDTVSRSHSNRKKGELLGDAMFTLFSELIGNVYDHSGSTLDGYAALQRYAPRGRPPVVEVAVSDSGVGILATLRPALIKLGHIYADLDDADLLYKAISEGVSKNGPTHGCGLRISAHKALKFGANLEIRLPECRMNLVPKVTGYRQEAMAYGCDGLPHIDGTHLCFDFRLDT